jgi:hypothetical protein
VNEHPPTCPECGSTKLAYERKGFVTPRLAASGGPWEVAFAADDGSGWVRCDDCDWESAEDDNAQHPVVAEAFALSHDFSLEVMR